MAEQTIVAAAPWPIFIASVAAKGLKMVFSRWTQRLDIAPSMKVGGALFSAYPTHELSRRLLSSLERLGCLSFRSALASICRIRSRVTENCWPTSSRVRSLFMPRPKRYEGWQCEDCGIPELKSAGLITDTASGEPAPLIKATRPQFDLPPQSNWPTTQPGRSIARFPHEDLTIAFPPRL
jgi:hypothetical protein